ncbi:hypothetical protein D3C71_1533720 [compost metagenome]
MCIQEWFDGGIGARHFRQHVRIHIHRVPGAVDQQRAFIGVGTERVLDGGDAHAVLVPPCAHVAGIALRTQLMGSGDRLRAGLGRLHRLGQTVIGDWCLATAGLDLAVPDRGFAEGRGATGGAWDGSSVLRRGGGRTASRLAGAKGQHQGQRGQGKADRRHVAHSMQNVNAQYRRGA